MDWIYKADDPLFATVVGSILLFFIIIILTRLVGLRSFAKFTAYDFAFTIALGSILAATLTSSTTVVHGAVAIASLLVLTFIFSYLQRVFPVIDTIISNKPLLLMKGSTILEDNLKHARIQKSQLMSKLREANVLRLEQVQMVVLESTGDISVLHTDNDTQSNNMDNVLCEDVRETP